MNRREFVCAAASAALLAGGGRLAAQAARYDLIIKGGRVIDPSLRLDAVRDIGIAAGRIAAVEPRDRRRGGRDARCARQARRARLDRHPYARGAQRRRAGVCLRDGVTGWIDAGSAGADNSDPVVAIAKAAPQTGRVLINIGRGGILPDGDTKDLALADVGAARAAIERHRDYVVGIKARLSETVVGKNDVEVLRRTQQVVEPFGLPVMIHMGQSASSLRELLPCLRPATSSRTCSRRRRTRSSTTTAACCPRCSQHAGAASCSTSATASGTTFAGTSSSGSCRPGLLARHDLDRLERHEPHDGRHRFPELHVEAASATACRSRRPSRARR